MDTILTSISIKNLQRQVANTCLTIASLQTQIDQIEQTIKELEKKISHPITVYEPSPDELKYELASNNLHIDDSDSDGYDSDNAIVRASKIKTKKRSDSKNQYVLIKDNNEVEEYDD